MAFKKTQGEVIGELKEEYAILSESDRSDWVTGLVSVSWKGKDPKTEIRNYNKTMLKDPEKAGRGFGKGIALNEEELNVLAEELVRMGYGNSRDLRIALKKRKAKEEES